MTVYIGLLRGVNVGGVKLPMADLRRIAGDLGHTDVSTYIQSGNLLFRSTRRGERALSDELTAAIKADLGIAPAVVLRTVAQLDKAIAANPYETDEADPKTLHVTFFADNIDRAALDGVDLEAYRPESVTAIGRELYYLLPNGIGRSKLAADLSRRKTVKIGTTRNWRTVLHLADLAHELG